MRAALLRRSLLVALLLLAAGACLPSSAAAAEGQIRVHVRDDFGNPILGGTVVYSCGSGEQSVTDESADDLDATDGTILITPAVAASCDIADDLVVRVENLAGAGYLNWLEQTFYDTARENTFIATVRFTVMVRLTDEFSEAQLAAPDAAGTFTDGTTVAGVRSPDNTKLGFPVPIGSSDGSITVTGLGSLGYLNTTHADITVPSAGDQAQRTYNSRNQFSVLVLGRDQFGQELIGSGGSALFQSGAQIACPNQTGTNLYGCPVPVGAGASTVRVTRPGYVDYVTGAAAPPAAATGVQTAVLTGHLFAVRVLGIADEFGGTITPTSTPDIDPPFLASGTDILGMRRSGNEWYIVATPGSAQLTAQVNGYANAAVRVDISAVGQATVDYDGPTGSTWGAAVDGPPLEAGMYVTVFDAAGVPVPEASVGIYTAETYGTALANDLRTAGLTDASRLTGTDGTAKFALPTGRYWVRIVKGGLVSWGSAADPKAIGYIESGGPYRYVLRVDAEGPTGALAGRASGQAAVSAERSTIVAVPGAVAADGVAAVTVTVTARDAAGNPLNGRGVSVASSRGALDAWSATVGTTDASGAAVFTLRSTAPGAATLTATIDGTPLTGGITVSFTTGGSGGLAYAPGTLLKLACPAAPDAFHRCRAVYHYGADGKRHAFPNEKTYRSWFADFSGVITLDEASLAAIPLGANVRYRPGVRLVKVPSVPSVYALERGVLRALAGEAVAAGLYGSAWATQIDDLNESTFGDYAVGSPIAATGDYSPPAARDGTTTIEQDFGR